MRIGSLFSGIGGLELGLERAGVGQTVWQVEIDPFCRAVLAKHWPDAERHEDVRIVGRGTLARVDLICGGFPCQDVSLAGDGAGIKEGTRSGLWIEFARILHELQPEWSVVENVAGGAKRWVPRVRGDLCKLGYDSAVVALSAADVGAPHLRRRLFVVAHSNGRRLGGERSEGVLNGEWASFRNNAHGRGREMAHAHGARCPGHRRPDGDGAQESRSHGRGQDVADGVGHILRIESWGGSGENGPSARIARHDRAAGRRVFEPVMGRDAHGVSQGLDRWPAGRGAVQHGWEPPRTIPKGEYANRRRRLKALGNAVVPQCMEVIGRLILHLQRLREAS